MRPHTFSKAFVLCIFCLLSLTISAQVKIGGEQKESPHPSSVLELKSTDKGFLLPRMNRQQINAINDPADALIVYDTDMKGVVIYSKDQQQWLPLLQQVAASALPSDTCEWAFDTTTLRVFLKRGYPSGDSIYYNTARKKFVFADKITFGDTPVPADVQFPGKFMVKGTASRIFNDSASISFPSLTLANFLFEVDNDSFALANPNIAFYNGMRISTQLLPTAKQRVNTIRAMNLQLNNSSADSVTAVTSVVSNSFLDGRGFTNQFSGIQNNLVIGDSIKGVGAVLGYRNIITGPGSATGRVNNVFGYQGTLNGFTDSSGNSIINGNAYGVFLNSITAASPRRNFAFYSNKGHNRFADSTLITDGSFISPRAVLDINSTSAMIIPTGTTAQRPVTGVAGMFRNNTTIQTPEYFDGTIWQPFSTGANEWKFDATTNKVNLVRGLPLGDSVYYNAGRKKFVFADKLQSDVNSIPADIFYPGKYIFKGTASRIFHDAASLNFPSITLSNVLLDVDNDSFAIANPNTAFYNGMRIATQMLPGATQRASTIRSLLLQLNHNGQDTINAVTALASNAFLEGKGFASTFNGIQNNLVVSDSAIGNVGSITGYRNSISMSGNGGRVLGSVFGYSGNMSGFADSSGNSRINGNAYGIFLNTVAVAAPGRNYAYFSNKGRNRFGDSTLITDGGFTAPRAIFDINSTTAMITPAGSTAQRPAAPVAAMLRFNNTGSNMEYYNGTSWKAMSGDTAEWKFDASTSQVNLVRGLPVLDTIFYNPQRRQFVFADRRYNTNSLGQDFPVENFGAKYTFKTTASQRNDSLISNGANVNIVYEADNSAITTVYNALTTSAVINPKALQKSDQVSGISNTVIHAGNDSAQAVIGISSIARNSGNGKSGTITGIQNIVRIQNGTANNTGEMVGVRTIMGRVGASAGRVTGNVYGWFGSFTGLANNVDGNVYGVFLSTVSGAGPRKNFAFYSNKGLNRLGDSVLITDGASITPRAVLDVNATSAMIVPTGTTAQRPAAAVSGMVRYNTENGGRLESYNGTSWSGILSSTVAIDPPNIASGSGVTLSFVFNGATTGSAVAISPTAALPGGIIIAWSRVSAANTIEVRFENNSLLGVNPASIVYNVKVIQ